MVIANALRVLLVCAALFGASAAAQTASPVFDAYVDPADPTVPEPVRAAAQSVFLIGLPNNHHGSMFVFEQPGRFATARHNVQILLWEQVRQAGYESLQLPFFLTEHMLPLTIRGAAMQWPFPGVELSITLDTFDPSAGLFESEPMQRGWWTGRRILSDAVLLRTSQPVGMPLQRARETPRIGEALYLIGYPRRYNAEGGRLMVSMGRRTRVQPHEITIGMFAREPDRRLSRTFYRHLLAADFQCDRQTSGGPAVNERGEVVGMLIQRVLQPETPDESVSCILLNMVEFDALRDFWDENPY